MSGKVALDKINVIKININIGCNNSKVQVKLCSLIKLTIVIFNYVQHDNRQYIWDKLGVCNV